jgi:RHH-type rel operon transcriptional repressor/antitoxin RelB
MAVSVRMNPLLERELEAAAKRLGKTKSQFIIEAVERSLGRKNPYELMQRLVAEEQAGAYGPRPPKKSSRELPYDTDASKQALRAKLRAKHGVGSAG